MMIICLWINLNFICAIFWRVGLVKIHSGVPREQKNEGSGCNLLHTTISFIHRVQKGVYFIKVQLFWEEPWERLRKVPRGLNIYLVHKHPNHEEDCANIFRPTQKSWSLIFALSISFRCALQAAKVSNFVPKFMIVSNRSTMWYAFTSTVCLFSGCNNPNIWWEFTLPRWGAFNNYVWPNFDHLPNSSGQLWTVYILHKEILARVVCHFQNKGTVRLCVGTKKFERMWKSTQFQVTCSFGWIVSLF